MVAERKTRALLDQRARMQGMIEEIARLKVEAEALADENAQLKRDKASLIRQLAALEHVLEGA